MGAKPPCLDGDEIALAVAQLSREPFQDMLARLIEGQPDGDAIRAFANKYPDRWVHTLGMLAALGGYPTMRGR